MIQGFQDFYQGILNWSLDHKRITFTAIMALVIASFGLIGGGFIGVEFVANGDNGEFQIKVELPKESPLEQTNFLTQQVEQKLLNDPMVTNVFTTVGASDGGNIATGGNPYLSTLNVKLVPADQRTLTSNEYAAKVKLDLQETLPGAKFTAAPVSMVGGAGAAPIQFQIQGADLDTILAYQRPDSGTDQNGTGNRRGESLRRGRKSRNRRADRPPETGRAGPVAGRGR